MVGCKRNSTALPHSYNQHSRISQASPVSSTSVRSCVREHRVSRSLGATVRSDTHSSRSSWPSNPAGTSASHQAETTKKDRMNGWDCRRKRVACTVPYSRRGACPHKR